MRAKIFCRTGKFQGLECQFESDVSIGRAKDNGLHLDDSSVSGYHARIHYDQNLECYTLADTNSRNGTRLDGQRVRHSEALEDLHIISIAGKHDLIFQDLTNQDDTVMIHSKIKSPPNQPKAEKPSQPAAPKESPTENKPDHTLIEESIVPPPVPTLSPAPTPPPDINSKTIAEQDIVSPPELDNEKTIDQHDSEAHRTVADSNIVPAPPTPPPPPTVFTILVGAIERELTDGEYSIGRVEGNDIVVNENSISRKHATLKMTGNKVVIKDSESKNGVHVDGVRIETQTLITTNSRVLLGEVTLSIRKKV